MRVLALEPYYGGSHRAFLDGWSNTSRHEWTILGLPARKWKWRMRHAAMTFAEGVARRSAAGERWDAVFCSDMLDLAAFRGLAPPPVNALPSLAYFHENQLTYPVRHEHERDYHFGLTNMTTALAAREVWFNSGFHRDSFLGALERVLRKMPDFQPLELLARIRAKSRIRPPGIAAFPPRGPRRPGPVRLLWAARWEHDKNPGAFFAALDILKEQGINFRLDVIGQRFRDVPQVFERARVRFADHIDHWGYQASRRAYEAVLLAADVVVSTAEHEFFGLSIVEAAAAGAYPLLPRRLAYPEIFAAHAQGDADDFFYEDGPEGLAERLVLLARRLAQGRLWQTDPDHGRALAARYAWSRLTPILDRALQSLAVDHTGGPARR